jgi:acetyltransferase-like isoleucine patch superfamily enzyme
MRGALYASIAKHIHRTLRVDSGTRIRHLHKLKVGVGVWLKEGVLLNARSDKEFGIVLGDGVVVRCYSYLDAYGGSGQIVVGARSGIGQSVYIGGNGGVHIGRDVMISGHTFIVAATHGFDPSSDAPYARQAETRAGIYIEDGAWIASNCVVMDGVRVGTLAVVGAGSVVTRSIPPRVLAAGNPARVIRELV